MDVLALLVAIVALILAATAFKRTGGIGMLREQLQDARRLSANAIERLEEAVRPEEGATSAPPRPGGAEKKERPADAGSLGKSE